MRCLKTNHIKKMFIAEFLNKNIKDSGYDLQNGRKYIEIRNAQFLVDKEYIFPNIPSYTGMIQWYKENYNPIALPQIDKCTDKLANPNSRQAIIFMGDKSEYNKLNEMICTMYMHVFLDNVSDNNYNMQYIVHMRSSDCIEFQSDIKWHKYIIRLIINSLNEKHNYSILNIDIIWDADSFQLYDKQFNNVFV